MLLLFILCFTLALAHSIDVPSLPYCPENYQTGLVIVSTLDGKISALNSNGSLVWDIDTGPGPLLLSNIHDLELTNNGEWIRIIPSLTGTLYKFDGATVDPIPISAEDLLKSSFLYSKDLVVAGGLEIRTYGVGFRTGTIFYECNPLRCLNNKNNDDEVLLIERSTRTIRAVEPRTGIEKWNFSVGLHNIKLPRISCIDENLKVDWNFTAIIPEGHLFALMKHNDKEKSWHYSFAAPIVRIWQWNGRDLSEVNIFSLQNTQQIVGPSFFPSLYLGMHKSQLYIHESESIKNQVEEMLDGKSNSNIVVTEGKSIAKIPWKPIRASTVVIEDDATAISVLNGSDYVNGHGFYLYTEEELKSKNSVLCKANISIINNIHNYKTVEKMKGIYTYMYSWWKELFLLMLTSVVFHMILKFWNKHHSQKEIVVIEKPIDAQIVSSNVLESKDTFSSRFENDFEMVRCLGKGGFGVVFEVKQKYDECSYAIKRITLPKEQQSRERVMREVKALAKLDHQNIVRYFGSWVENPPLGWQEKHDEKWMKDHSLFADEIFSTNQKVKRSKSVSVSIDIPLNDIESDISFLDDEHKEDSDDSFIVFESSEIEQDSNYCKSSKVENKNFTTLSNANSKESDISSVALSDHLKKRIDWKKPGRKHYSWDLSLNRSPKQENPHLYLYIQMQLCKEKSLKEWLTIHKERDYALVLHYFSEILEAVDYVHDRGLIHRDLKPSNIFFSLNGQIKVGDFGLVKDVEDAFDRELIKKGSLSIYRGHTVEVGTQLYMSPEQFKSRIYDNKVDIYSLGIILFELLVPFSTEMERIKTLTNVKKSSFPTDFLKKFPDEYSLIQKMLCEDPGKRLSISDIKVKAPFNREDSGYSEYNPHKLKPFKKS